MDRSSGTGETPGTAEQRGAPGAAPATGEDTVQQVRPSHDVISMMHERRRNTVVTTLNIHTSYEKSYTMGL